MIAYHDTLSRTTIFPSKLNLKHCSLDDRVFRLSIDTAAIQQQCHHLKQR